MAVNVERREQLADAGLEVLADQGARGLTFRAVDERAEVPRGTSSNYFRSRAELLGGLAGRILTRLEPDPTVVSRLESQPRTSKTLEDHMVEILERTTHNRSLMLALLELRLEAARFPDVADALRRAMAEGFAADVEYQINSDLPGGEVEVELLYHAITGLIIDSLTISVGGTLSPEQTARELTRRIIAPVVD